MANMTTITSQPITTSDKNFLLCHFFNERDQVVVIRITNIPNWYLERVVFPAQRLMFEAPEGAVLEVYSPEAETLREDTIPCHELCVKPEMLLN